MYAYKAVDAQGKVVKGKMQGNGVDDVMRALRSTGHTPISIATATSGFQGRKRKSTLSDAELVLFLTNLQMLLSAGIDLNAALGALLKSARSLRLKTLAGEVRASVQKGDPLSAALLTSTVGVPTFVTSSIRAGEAGGQLKRVLGRLCDHVSRFERFRSELLSALIYPVILLVMAAVSIAVLVTVVIPQFKPLFEGAGSELPFMTRLVVGVSDAVTAHGLALTIVALLIALLCERAIRIPRFAKALDQTKLRLPLGLGDLLTRIEAARFCRLLALLLESGVPLVQSLTLIRDATGNLAVRASIETVSLKVQEGRRLAFALTATPILPEAYRDILEVGEEASQLEFVLARVSEMAEQETEMSLKRFMAVFVPALTIGLGGLVAVIIMSVLLALLSANELVLQ